jgi:2-polyprenyl-3-methyl-5-hydroxy-6-metoxy-1,4-benzoquinol methylase
MTRTHERYSEYREDQREFFDRLVTDDWDSYHSEAWDRRRRAEVDALFRHVSPSRIIDVGCGVGFHDAEMAGRPGVTQVHGVDYSEQSVIAANREYPHPAVERWAADVFALAPADYDLAVSFQVIEHLSDPRGFLEACRSQVRPGGWVAIGTPNRLRIDNRIARLRRRPVTFIDPQHFHEYTPRELVEMGRPLGLEPVATEGFGMSMTIPKLGRQAISRDLGEKLGPRIRPLADVFLQVWTAR